MSESDEENTRLRAVLGQIIAEVDCPHWTGSPCEVAMRNHALMALGWPIDMPEPDDA